jgi:hypothetical protein
MLDSDFWRDLAEKFRAIKDPHNKLHAIWQYTVKVDEQPPPFAEWNFGISDQRMLSVRYEFETVARRGGPKVHPYMDSLIGWLEALRESGLNAEMSGSGIKSTPDGALTDRTYSGRISRICEASADLCKQYESLALEMERVAQVQEEARIKSEPHNAYRAALDENEGRPEAPETEPEAQPGESTPKSEGEMSDCKARRRASVDTFLQQCNRQSSAPIRRRHIWLSVGHSKGRQFEYWQGCDPKATMEDHGSFGRILRMKPGSSSLFSGRKAF